MSTGDSNSGISKKDRLLWQVPEMEIDLWLGRRKKFCVVIPVINEGERIRNLLSRMQANNISNLADIIIIDGGSVDDSLRRKFLEEKNVRGLMKKCGPGGVSAQLRCAYAFALDEGYEGIVTIDGNDKDDPKAIPLFIEALQSGMDFVQGSRFISGGVSVNIPKLRYLAIRYLHAPCLSFASGFKWSDTTQGFRGYSSRLLLDKEIAPFRDIFSSYELLAYLSYRAPRLSYNCLEIPTSRCYPKGEMVTKITPLKGNLSIFRSLLNACMGGYNPKRGKS